MPKNKQKKTKQNWQVEKLDFWEGKWRKIKSKWLKRSKEAPNSPSK